jgi:hypothetical protein
MSSTASTETKMRWDYAMQNLDDCYPSGVTSVGYGVWSDLGSTTLYVAGYPSYHTCPANTSGVSNAPTGDCPQSGGQGNVQVLPANLARPFTGGNLFWSPSGTQTGKGTGYWQLELDSTAGMSGGSAIYYSGGVWYSVGAVSGGYGSGKTGYNSMTWEVYGWLFP